jgi:cytochrome c-type biogenesis protein CcmH
VRRFLFPLLILLLPLSAHADPAVDQRRAEALYTEVRCVQCQSESIADSDAQIAADMRALIREDIKQGLSDAQIRKTLSDHYGDYVLFRPRLSKSNLLLWFLPLLIIVGGVGALWVTPKKTAKSNDYALSPEDQEKLDELMRPRD